MAIDYGRELTNNSKASWAFSIPRSRSCINATAVCLKLCYGNGVRYQSDGQKAKRQRNLRTIELLLDNGGPSLWRKPTGLNRSSSTFRLVGCLDHRQTDTYAMDPSCS